VSKAAEQAGMSFDQYKEHIIGAGQSLDKFARENRLAQDAIKLTTEDIEQILEAKRALESLERGTAIGGAKRINEAMTIGKAIGNARNKGYGFDGKAVLPFVWLVQGA